MKTCISVLLLGCVISATPACTNHQHHTQVDTEKRDGYTINTYYNAKEQIDSVVLKDKEGAIVAIPSEPVARARKMSDEEYQCLKKCRKPDGSYDTNCTLLCPVTKKFAVTFSRR